MNKSVGVNLNKSVGDRYTNSGSKKPFSTHRNKMYKVKLDSLLMSIDKKNNMIDVSQKVPKKMFYDQEKLYEDNINLKHNLNNFQTENLQLKTRQNQLLERLEQVQNNSPNRQVSIISNMKEQIREFQKENKMLKQDINNIQTSAKFTKLNELTKQNSNLERIVRQLKEEIKQNEKLQKELSDVKSTQHFQIVKKDNISMAVYIKEQQLEINKLEITKSDLARQVTKLQSQNNTMTKENKNYMQENVQMKQRQQEPINKLKEAEKDIQKFKNQYEDTLSELLELKQKYEIQQQEKEKLQDQNASNLKKICINENELQSQKEIYLEIIDKQNQQLNENDQNQNKQRVQARIFEQNQNNENNNKNKLIKPLNVPKVSKQDILQISNNIINRLQIFNITFETSLTYLISENNIESQKISVKQILQRIQQYPFFVKNEEDAILISRYLIEDNSQEMIVQSENTENQTEYVTEIFKDLVKGYKLMEVSYANELYIQICNTLDKYTDAVQITIKQDMKQNKIKMEPGLTNFEIFKHALKPYNLDFNDDHFDLLKLITFKITENSELLDYSYIAENFNLIALQKANNNLNNISKDKYIKTDERKQSLQ